MKGYSDRPTSCLTGYTTKSSVSLFLRKARRKCPAHVVHSLSRGMETLTMVKRWLEHEESNCEVPKGLFSSQVPI